MFESAKDAKNYAETLAAKRPNALTALTPVITAIKSQEAINFCKQHGYEYEFIDAGKKILPPSIWKEKLNYNSFQEIKMNSL